VSGFTPSTSATCSALNSFDIISNSNQKKAAPLGAASPVNAKKGRATMARPFCVRLVFDYVLLTL